jgi:hypothetical protein
MIPSRSADTRGTHLANVSAADEQDVRPHGISPSRNAARENDSNDRSPHSTPADRTNIFFPNDEPDDPRASSRAHGSRRLEEDSPPFAEDSPPFGEGSPPFAFALAAVLAGDVIVPGELLALYR